MEGCSWPEGNIVAIEDSSKYLGIPRANGNLEKGMRKSATAKCLQKVKEVLMNQLNQGHKIQAETLSCCQTSSGVWLHDDK